MPCNGLSPRVANRIYSPGNFTWVTHRSTLGRLSAVSGGPVGTSLGLARLCLPLLTTGPFLVLTALKAAPYRSFSSSRFNKGYRTSPRTGGHHVHGYSPKNASEGGCVGEGTALRAARPGSGLPPRAKLLWRIETEPHQA